MPLMFSYKLCGLYGSKDMIGTIILMCVYYSIKEYNLLCLLAVNNGRVLSYSQIYEKVWGEALTVNERGTVGYHVRNLRRKLYSADPHHPFIIESIREIGYRFQTTS